MLRRGFFRVSIVEGLTSNKMNAFARRFCSESNQYGSSSTVGYVSKSTRGINKVILVGNVGKDAQVKSIEGGGHVAFFPLATNQVWTSKEGERVNRPQWHNVVIYNENYVSAVQQGCKRGALVYIEGMIQYRKYVATDGKEKNIAEVVVPKYRGEVNVLSGQHSRGDGYDGQPHPDVTKTPH